MRMFSIVSATILAASTSFCVASVPTSSSPFDDAAQLTSSFSVSKTTEVPGAVLKSGRYSIHVVDHLADRVVLQIEGPTGKTLTTFLGLPSPGFRTGVSNGPVPWSSGPKGEEALRGFAFPGGVAVEFVYPKAEAVSIAQVNTGKVAAIDPASQGMPAETNGAKLSKTDMQMVNLWMLSTTHVGSGDNSQPAIQAERYQQPAPVQTAEATPPPSPASYSPAPAAQPRPSRVRPIRRVPANTQMASNDAPQGLTALPHTASDLPLIFLSGILALLGAAILAGVRQYMMPDHADAR
jgi:hypothetical protein